MIRQRLRHQLYLAMASVVAVALLVSALANGFVTVKRERDLALATVSSQLSVIAYNIEPALLFDDATAAAELLAGLQAQPQYLRTAVFLMDGQPQPVGRRFAATGSGVIEAGALVVGEPLINNNTLRHSTWIGSDKAPNGLIVVDVTLPSIGDVLSSYLLVALLVLLVAGALAGLLAMRFTRLLAKPVDDLAELAEVIVSGNNWHLRAPQASFVELSRLSDSFNRVLITIESEVAERQQRQQQVDELNRTLENKVQERTLALADRNGQLQQTLERLSRSQAQLVEREKMASLGELVAGVAHEINTPVGIGITATSMLRGESQHIRQAMEQGTLSQRQFNEFLKSVEEGTEITWRNLERAAELIRSFKQVAVDQSSEAVRQFDLYSYFVEVINSLKPKLRRANHQVILDGTQQLIVNAQPGHFAQLLTNLVMNSLIHGFDGMDNGVIRISLTLQEQLGEQGLIRFEYSDNGHGISSDNLRKLFVPFFTTRRNYGGSGLGTHIVYNIVTHALHGSISATSEVGRGLSYLIEFPVSLVQSVASFE